MNARRTLRFFSSQFSVLTSVAAPSAPPPFGRIRAIERSAGARRSKEQLLPVRVGDVAAVGAVHRMVPRLVAVHDQLGPELERFLGDAAAQQGVRRATLDHPL